MKYKIIFMLFILLIISGCSAKYDLTFNKDGTITENVRISESNSLVNYYGYDNYKDYINTFLQYEYQPYNRKFLENNDYNYSTFLENGFFGINAEKKYKSIDEYINDNKSVVQFFESFDIVRNGNIVTLETKNYLGVVDTISYQRYQIETAEINLKIPWKVIETNADLIDEKNKTYTWYITPNLTDVKIFIKYKENKIIKILSNSYTIIALDGIILLVLLVFIVKFVQTSKKNNEI